MPERGALQRLEGHDAAFGVLRLAPRDTRRLGEPALAVALGLQRGDEPGHALAHGIDGRARLALRLLDLRECLRDVRSSERTVLACRAFTLRDEPAQLVVHFLEARPLCLGRGRRGAQRLVELLPALLPVVHRRLGRGKRLGRGLFGRPRRFEARFEFG